MSLFIAELGKVRKLFELLREKIARLEVSGHCHAVPYFPGARLREVPLPKL
jgi:hypothetical protein